MLAAQLELDCRLSDSRGLPARWARCDARCHCALPRRCAACPARLQPGQPTADELAQQAAALYQAVPPAQLARQRGIQLEHSAAIDAYLR